MNDKEKKDLLPDEKTNESAEMETSIKSDAEVTKTLKTNKIITMVSAFVAVVAVVAVALVLVLGGNENDDPQHVHSFGEWELTQVAGCENNGTKERYCSCGEKQTSTVEPTGHSFGSWTVVEEATCLADGKEKRECSCGERETRSIDKINTHTEVIDAAVEATCTSTGLTEGKHCSVCNTILVEQTEIAAKSHTYDDKYDADCNDCGFERDPQCRHSSILTISGKAATCTSTGLTEGKKCLNCGETLVKQTTISATGHSFSAWIVVNKATCAAEGSKKRECACGEIETRSIEKLNTHTEVIDARVEPTCKDTGLTEGKHCSVCGDTIVAQKVIDKLTTHTYTDRYDATCNICNYERDPDCAHTNKVTDPGKVATCTEDGLTEGQKCAKCGEVLVPQTIIGAKGHTKGAWVTDKEATCTEKGIKHQECTACHETIGEETVNPLGHTESSWIIEKEATCTSEGRQYKKCTECNERLDQKSISVIPHTEDKWIIDKNATCTEDGSKHTNCTVCGNIVNTQTITKLGHLGGEWIYDKQPTCIESGARHKLCTRCNNTFDNENISAIGHKKGNSVTEGRVESTCTEDGYYYEVVYCSASGCNYEFSKTKKIIKSTGHNYSNGSCTKCGAADPYPGAIRIYSYTDLVNMKNNLSATYVLMNDIDCQGLALVPIGSNESSAFTGLFDGQGYTISNYVSSNADHVGIIGYNRGTVRNLNVKDFVYDVSAVSSNTVNIGGIVGFNAGLIEQCAAFNGDISATMDNTCRGGLICGYNMGNVLNCFASGNVYITEKNNSRYNWKTCGGITAGNEGKIENCFVDVTVFAIGYFHYSVGSPDPKGEAALICATNEKKGTISNCLVMGSVTQGNNRQGDICGRNDGTITNCYRDSNVVLGGKGKKFEYATSQSLSNLSKLIIYSVTLGWDSEIWDYTNVNLANKVYPTLKQN